MEVILETKLKSVYPILEEGLRRLGLSSYEIIAYTTLLNLRRPADKEEILKESRKFGKLPKSKIYAVLSELEKKNLIIKSSGYPRFYEVDTRKEVLEQLIERKTRILENEKKELEHSLRNKLEQIWLKCILQSEGIWEIDEKDVKNITRDMWYRANREIMLMTRSGDWLPETKELLQVLENKSRLPNFRVLGLVSKHELIEPEKIEKTKEFENFLNRIGASVYHYTPGTFRMNVVDRRECLFLMYEYKKPYIFYTPIKEVAESLARVFILECLVSDEYKECLRQMAPQLNNILKNYVEELFQIK